MSTENTPKIDDILNMLNSPDVADKLKDVLSSLSSEEGSSPDISNLLSSVLNSSSDSTTNLLSALKPYLNLNRQKKIDQCEKFMSMAKAFQLMNTLNKDSD